MEIICPSCETRYNLDPRRIPRGARSARCGACGDKVVLPERPPVAAMGCSPLPLSNPGTGLEPVSGLSTAPAARTVWPRVLGGAAAGLVAGLALALVLPPLAGRDAPPAPVAATGDTVAVHYIGRLGDGTVFESSGQQGPARFTIGAGKLLAGFEQAVVGMRMGEIRTVTLPAALAFGSPRQDRILRLARNRLPAGLDLAPGKRLTLTRRDGGTFTATVTALSGDSVTVDANHPLAGRDLVFEIRLVELVKRTRFSLPDAGPL